MSLAAGIVLVFLVLAGYGLGLLIGFHWGRENR
jgi:hypothetical protein